MSRFPPAGSKTTWLERAEDILYGRISTGVEDVPMLLEWLQDGNWPGAEEIARHLSKYDAAIIEPVRSVLEGKDGLWAYWVLSLLVARLTGDACQQLGSTLWVLAAKYDEEECHMEALRICVKHRLAPVAELSRLLSEKKVKDPENLSEYEAMCTELEE